jgi:predicted transcriptional regulator
MLRGHKDIAAEIPEEIITVPNHAPSRIIATAGTNYTFLKILTDKGLVNFEKIGKKRARSSITEKGRTFLHYYRICNELLPAV